MFLVVYILTFRSQDQLREQSHTIQASMVRQERSQGSRLFFLQAAAVEVAVRADGQERNETDFLVESAFEDDFLSVCDYFDKSNQDRCSRIGPFCNRS